jgi:subtilase family serine protease
MRRPPLTARVAALAAVCAVSAPVAIAAASAVADGRATATLAGSVAAVTANSSGVGAVSGTESKTIEVWMAGHEQAAQRFVDAVSTPGSPAYHRFLSPTAYTDRFGPSAVQMRAVGSYLIGKGFTRVHASVNDDYVSATGSVSRINRAFSVQMRRYEVSDAEGRSTTIESNDRGLTVPTSISSDILAVTGLNTTQPQPAATTGTGAGGATSTTSTSSAAKAPACSKYWAQKTTTITPAFQGLTQAALPVCGYSAKQIRAAYGLSSADTGAGKTIALIEVGGPDEMFQALGDYAKANGLRAPRSDRFREEAIGQHGHHGRCLGDPAEEATDSEAAYAMAPGAKQLIVLSCWNGSNFNQAVLDAELAPLTGHGSRASAAIESTSLGLGAERSVPRSQLKTSHAIALRAAAEGVSLLAYSGDAPGILSQASDPDVTAVGGTTLGIGSHNQRLFETGWSTLFGDRTGTSGPWNYEGVLGGAGGGASTIYGEPSYQQGIVPSALAQNSNGRAGRTVPDIAADADAYSAMLMGYITTDSNGKPTPYTSFSGGGTSQSTPLVAGMVADAEQGHRKDLGFLNPLLYSLAGTRAFHDILPISPSDPQVDRLIYTRGLTDINHKYAQGYRVGVTDAQGLSGTKQVTAPGYDTMTGLGTPNGSAFIKALRSGKQSSTR